MLYALTTGGGGLVEAPFYANRVGRAKRNTGYKSGIVVAILGFVMKDNSSPDRILVPPIGIIAGNGQFPIECIAEAERRGLAVVIIAHRGETDPTIAEDGRVVRWVRVGQLGSIIRFFKKHKVASVICSGGIRRVGIFQGARPDWRALRVIARVGSLRDDEILRGIADELGSEGMPVIGAEQLLADSLPLRGCLTRRAIRDDERKSADVGWRAAAVIGSLDIGQTVCVKDGVVVAVEGVEGTDATIERAGALAGPGVIVVKRAKPQQDMRLDLPAVGEQTIAVLKKANAAGLVLEEKRALLLKPDAIVRSADAAGLFIEVW